MARGLRIAYVPEKYRTATWETCRVADDLAQYVHGMSHHVGLGRGVILFGPVGTGKSSAAALLVQEAIRREITAHWVYVPDLKDVLAMRSEQRRREMDRQRGVDLLVWDDFGIGGLADWEIGWLDQIVEHRYARRRAMVVTTNLTPEDLKNDDRLARMVDRWREKTMAVVVAGESMRERDRDL